MGVGREVMLPEKGNLRDPCGGGGAVYLDCINVTIPVMISTIVLQVSPLEETV